MSFPGLAIGQPPGWRSLRPPLGKRFTSKSPDIPAVYHSQIALPYGVADTDTLGLTRQSIWMTSKPEQSGKCGCKCPKRHF